MEPRKPLFDVKLGKDLDVVQFVFQNEKDAEKFISDTGISAVIVNKTHYIDKRAKYKLDDQFQYIVRVKYDQYNQHCPGGKKPDALFRDHPNSRFTGKQIVFTNSELASHYLHELISIRKIQMNDQSLTSNNDGQYIINMSGKPYNELLKTYDYFSDLKPYKHMVDLENKLGVIATDFQKIVAKYEGVDADALNEIRTICGEWYYSNEKKVNEIIRVISEGNTAWKNLKRSDRSKEFFNEALRFDLQFKLDSAMKKSMDDYYLSTTRDTYVVEQTQTIEFFNPTMTGQPGYFPTNQFAQPQHQVQFTGQQIPFYQTNPYATRNNPSQLFYHQPVLGTQNPPSHSQQQDNQYQPNPFTPSGY